MKHIFLILAVFILLLGCNGKKNEDTVSERNIENEQEEHFVYTEIEDRVIKDIFAYNYDNGNGTILVRFTENNYRITIRKHEASIRLYLAFRERVTFFEKPYVESTELFQLELKRYYDVKILEVAHVVKKLLKIG